MTGDVFTAALRRLPSHQQEPAMEVAIRSAAGFGTVEIGSQLGLTWVAVNQLRTTAAHAVVQELHGSGYTPVECIRMLGVPTHQVHEALGSVNGHAA